MKLQQLVFGVAIGVSACAMRAQQTMPNMPGMKMDPQPTPPTQRTLIQGRGVKENNHINLKGAAASESVARSFQQQAGEPHAPPKSDSDADSLKINFQNLQELEAIDFHTGSSVPAPELLKEVMNREPLSVESFIAMADATNPTLAQAQHNVDRSKQQARQVGLPPNPVVGYSGEHIRGGQYQGGEEGAFFSQEFVLGRKLALRRDVYRAEGDANRFGVAIQRSRIHNDVAGLFVDALAAQQDVVIRERLLKVALDAQTNAHELERVGQADASDVLSAEIEAEQANIESVTSQRLFLSLFARLATYSGQSGLLPHPLTGKLIEPPLLEVSEVVAATIRDSPFVKQAQAGVSISEARIKSAKRETIPNLNLKAGEWYSGESLGANNSKAGWMSFAEAGVNVPLWNRNQGNVEAAKIELERAHREVTRTELITRNHAEPYVQQYETARFTADRYRAEMLPRARRSYELEVIKYQQMAQSYPHVLAAEHMLFILQLAYTRALNEEWKAAIALQNYTLTDGLNQPMSVGTDATTLNLPTDAGPGN